MTVAVKHTTTKTVTTTANGNQVTQSTTTSHHVTVKSLLDRFVDLSLESDPFLCAQFGIRKHEDKLYDISKKAQLEKREKWLALQTEAKDFADKAQAILSEEEATNLNVLLDTCEANLVQAGIAGEDGYAIELENSHFGGLFVHLEVIFQNYQRVETAEDLHNYKKRLELCEDQFDHMIENFRSGIRRGITLSKESIELVIQKFGGSAGPEQPSSYDEDTEAAIKSPLNRAEKCKELLGDEHFLVATIRDIIFPGYSRAKRFLVEEYQQHARQYPGIYGLPDYERQYANYIYQNTNVRYGADEIHQIGIKEVARIEALLNEAKTACGFEGTLQEFQTAIQDKEKFPHLYYENSDDVLADYNKICQAAKEKMVDYFEKFPKFECTVAPVPEFLEKQMPLALYFSGTPTKAGQFMANMRLHKIKPSHQKTALCLHEANPGHHHQVSLGLENEDLHLARRMVFQTSYAEGWGLYCEYLGEEMGFYKDPFQYFGRLELEQFRAIRLVVDSGLHGKGWSVEQAVDYMLSKVSMSRAEIESEVKRYCALPGQALSYKVGEFKIKELRRYAEAELGDKFDIKKFHSCIIDSGMVPLGTLETIIKKWVASVKAA
ncbi:DUF885-domain-containing protein [Rhizoclosmatium globosum]|uniref:DUF885-domain-containing protein n=1 Tax=Rhizoclosmatium globosum TaxID=329046 RepID=A0A1Y2ANH8_9FUNG|nr:DUF885-domain-containing protein [Rhizoclosmatium globosum]|eukprot:ORY23767.1 DUF885-domain-containing protein [Rhizoclosmatium globosum]